MNKKFSKLIVILGSTASGKTGLAIELAKKFNGEIVCADSRTIYKWMNIGTAKPSKAEQKEIKHHLIDMVYPYEEFGLADFKEKAVKAVKDIVKRGKIPFLVGGTGLYIDAIVKNLEIPNIPPDKKLRAKLEKESLENLIEQLKKLDLKSVEKIGKNKRKIIRALEVCIKTGQKFSEIGKIGEPIFNALQIGISIPRPELYKRIDFRAEEMFKNGLIGEVLGIVKRLKKKGMSEKKIWTLPSMSGIGYRQIGMYFRKEVGDADLRPVVARDTRHYAKRQITWFKRDKTIRWVKNQKEALKEIKNFLKK
jgi:tRNA dimethylallyltransferase